MSQINHLTDQEIAQYAADSSGPGMRNQAFKSHIAGCNRCQMRLSLESERRNLGILETGLGSNTPTPNCPKDDTLEMFAIGLCSPEESREIFLHVADCSYCAPLLKAYRASLQDEGEEEATGAVVPARGLRKILQSFGSIIKNFKSIGVFPKLAVTGATCLTLAFLWPGPLLFNLIQLHRAESYAAAFSREKPPNEMRTTWSPYPKTSFQTMGVRPSPADYPNLASANQIAAEKLNSTDPRWIRLRGRVKLLLGEDEDATRLLAAASERGLKDPATEIDLAVAYFQRNTDDQGPDNKSPVGLSESLELLTKVLREPNLGQQEKQIALFDLAIVYEKMQLWDHAVLTWNKYLDLDIAGPWHDEALRRLEKSKEKISPKPQGYREPGFFLGHIAAPDVQENLEEYQDIALRAWLFNAAAHPDSEEAIAIRKLAELLEEKHGDPWMNDFLKARQSGDLATLHTLGSAITSNKQGQYTDAARYAHDAALAFNQDGNYPGVLRARFEEIYANQQLLDMNACLKQARALEKDAFFSRYRWLQVQTAAEEAVCLNFNGKINASKKQIDRALQRAAASGFRVLTLRVHSLQAAIQVSTNCSMTWQEAQVGLNLYWRGPASPQRLYEFLSPIKQCFERKKLWHAAEALERRMITILDHDISPDDENVVLEVTAHRALGQILRELGEFDAAADQERIAILLLPKVDKTIAATYEVPIKLELADLQLDQGDTDSALATMRDAESALAKTDNLFFHLDFFRIWGDIHLVRQQWNAAEEDYKNGIEIAEERLREFDEEEKRRQWVERAGDVYRGLVEVFLQQKRAEEALQLWEWYQARPLPKKSEPQSPSSKWQEIEQAILRQPLPSTSTTRLVYASTRCCLHIWTIESSGISIASLPEKREDLRRRIREYIEKCSMRQDPDLHVPEPDGESKELFSRLLQPVVANLRPQETVVIDLDMGMNALPLEALKSPEGWYFGQRFPVIYSAGYLGEIALRQIPQQKPRLGLVLYALGPGERNSFSGVFPELGTVDAADISPSGLSVLLEPGGLFAFFGHGDELGGLILRKGRPALKAIDFPPESLRHISLAVLAGCSTGVVMHDFLDTGDLVRAFHSAGTPSVIASHWNVNMGATSELMTSFSRHLSGGESIAHALFEARKETFQKYNHPYYWAGFVLSGRA